MEGRGQQRRGAHDVTRFQAMLGVAAVLGIAGPVASASMSLAAWLLAGALLRPVEAMRREAEAISAVRAGSGASPGRGRGRRDRSAGLGPERQCWTGSGRSVEGERRFLDDASHELRTPLYDPEGGAPTLALAARTDRRTSTGPRWSGPMPRPTG